MKTGTYGQLIPKTRDFPKGFYFAAVKSVEGIMPSGEIDKDVPILWIRFRRVSLDSPSDEPAWPTGVFRLGRSGDLGAFWAQ